VIANAQRTPPAWHTLRFSFRRCPIVWLQPTFRLLSSAPRVPWRKSARSCSPLSFFVWRRRSWPPNRMTRARRFSKLTWQRSRAKNSSTRTNLRPPSPSIALPAA